MYKSLMDILKCPICNSDNLFVQSFTEKGNQIYEGLIHCSTCKTEFPIIDGIPVLVDRNNQRKIIENWNTSGEYEEYSLEPTKKVSNLVQHYTKDTTVALDAGCGSGAYTRFFNSNEVICLDLIPFFLKKLIGEYRGNSKLHPVIADVKHLPIKEKSVDIIFCSSVLEHLYKEVVADVITNFLKICKGTILIDVPNDSNYLVLLGRYIFKKLGFYKGRIDNPTDARLRHHSRFGVHILKKMGFDVRGCIGWVSRKNIKLGYIWDLYDFIVDSCPSWAGTLIGIKRVQWK